jgi:hypothetical protein
MWWNPMFG